MPSEQSERLRCLSCGRFVSAATAHASIEYGDYGAVHSVEFECVNCAPDCTDDEFAIGGPAGVL